MRRKKVHIVVDVNSGVSRSPEKIHHVRFFPLPFKTLALFLTFTTAFFLSGVFQGRANATTLYPTACLGGWQNTHLAEGAPQRVPGGPIDPESSAFLGADIAGTIICSRFAGVLPDETRPLSLRVILHLGGVPTPEDPETDVAEPPVPQDTPYTELPLETQPDVPAPDPAPEISGESVIPIEAPVVPESPPVEAEEVVEPPTSWLHLFSIPTAHAAEEDSSVQAIEPAVEVVSIPEQSDEADDSFVPAPSVPETTHPEQNLPSETSIEQSSQSPEIDDNSLGVGDIVSIEQFEEPPSPEPEIIEPVTPSGEVLGVATTTDPFLEVAVSFNGVDRKVIEVLGEVDFHQAAFEIDVPNDFSWSDFERLEVSVARLPSIASHGAVLLDSVELVVSYETIPERVDPDESNTEADALTEQENFETSVSEDPQVETFIIEQEAVKLTRRVFTRQVVLDRAARHACTVEPFTLDISEREQTPGTITISHKGTPVRGVLEVGSFPDGVIVGVGEPDQFEYEVSAKEERIPLIISKEVGAQTGSFNISFFYTVQVNGKDSTALCQMNLLHNAE